MQLLLYHLFLWLYRNAIRIASLFDEKARQWRVGRRDIIQKIKTTLPHHEERIWIHCASVGEFEQARPLIEKIREQFPKRKILITFFSPSGYHQYKDYPLADYIFYLPFDGRRRSAQFVQIVNPSVAIFVKYEFWYYYISKLYHAKRAIILISGTFRPEQPFFKWYGGLFRKMLHRFSFIFLQDNLSKQLLSSIGIQENVAVTGDTRYDRVQEIAHQAKEFHDIETWIDTSHLLIAGSTWPEDEKLLQQALSSFPENWKLLLAPHEIDTQHLNEVATLFGEEAVFYSQLQPNKKNRVLIIDNIGMLSSLYRYGTISYVGGGFQKGGIHNTLEPAVFGLPVIFGPVYKKFIEATLLVENGFAFSVKDYEELKHTLTQLMENSDTRCVNHSQQLQKFVAQQSGATDKIMQILGQRYL
ncbi:MAG: 3-deoxy-D-manno-octulosonic acid transferase [Bacteroidetes bacterium]|nr:3-deoxy-D-manno-octulosonic acid transferase [Bacteroidota bacterium]